MRLPVLMFDFGNVVGFFDYGIVYKKLGARLGLSAAEFQARVEAGGMKSLLAQLEAGELTPEEFSRRLQREVGLNIPFGDFTSDWEDIFELNESVAALVAGLKKSGYTLVLGSNTNAMHAAFFRRRFRETLEHFDHFILSHEVRVMKPGRGFFEACVRAAGQPAGSCVFIDDVEENVRGAREAGLVGLVYRDTPGLVRELAALGVEVSSGAPGN